MTTDQTPLEGPTNGQRRVDQEEEGDGCENGEAIPKLRILSTLTVETGSRVATNTASQSWKPAFPHSFRNHDSILSWACYDVTLLLSPIHQEELDVHWSYQVRFPHTIFLNSTFLITSDQQSRQSLGMSCTGGVTL